MPQDEPKRLGLIGFGQFGEFAAGHLTRRFTVLATDRADRSAAAAEAGARWVDLEAAAGCPIVVLAVPVQATAAVLEAVRPHLRPGTLVVDVGSVKALPVRLMLELLPEEMEVLGTHPMFGPQSAADGLAGHRIVLCPARLEAARLERARAFLAEELGLDVIVTDPDTHDREIAETQGLAQYVGRALAALEASASPIRTPGYDRLRRVARTVGGDTLELFQAIQELNPHTPEVRRRFREALGAVDAQLDEARDAPASDGDS